MAQPHPDAPILPIVYQNPKAELAAEIQKNDNKILQKDIMKNPEKYPKLEKMGELKIMQDFKELKMAF